MKKVGPNVESLYFRNSDVRIGDYHIEFKNILLKRLELDHSTARFSNYHCTELILDEKCHINELSLPKVSTIIFKFHHIQALKFFNDLITYFPLTKFFVLQPKSYKSAYFKKFMKTMIRLLRKNYPNIRFLYS